MNEGSSIGPYRVLEKLGEGGMGEVYRATDTNLKRQVAIKVLPPAVAGDAERVARMRREAELLATLNHPNIAQIYGLEATSDELALVMELIEGPTLADRIAAGPLPLDEALAIATQIAEALEAAHDQGVIHRDLKPANVKLRPDGAVKVLDFGLAKSVETAVTTSPMPPTITTPAMTHAGVILGTAAYMSPEQARGRIVDRRTDVWAFGCVLFEMLAGRLPFADEETVSDTLATILKGEPQWETLPADTPLPIRSLIQRCLRKDVRRRLPHIAEARIEIEEAGNAPSAPAVETVPRGPSILWPAVAGLALMIAVAAIAWVALRPAPAVMPAARFDVTAPPGALPTSNLFRTVEMGDSISPDGNWIALVARVHGNNMIWLRRLDSLELRPVPRSEGASRVFWSADSRFLAFFVQGQLKKIDISGGPPIVVCNEAGRDVAWSEEDVVLIGGLNKPILRVPASGGDAVPVTALGPGETTHDYPAFLPDNRHFVYLARSGPNPENWLIYLGSLDSKERRRLDGIHTAARYSPTGHLLFTNGTTLMAQPFDADRLALSGNAVPVIEGVAPGPRPMFGVSANGTLAYSTPEARVESQLAWMTRSGGQPTVFTPTGVHSRVALSPDGRYVAFDREQAVQLFDIQRNAGGSFVNSPAADIAPVFSADSTRVAFASGRGSAVTANNPNAGSLYERAVTGGTDTLLLKGDAGATPTDWSRDGHLLYSSANDLWALSLAASGSREPVRLTNTPFVESGAKLSPDGRWLAYESNDSANGQDVYVQSFPDGGKRYPASFSGGSVPRWSRDGKELFYVAPDLTMMAAPIQQTGGELVIGKAVRLFQSPALRGGLAYDVAPDGRFLLTVPIDEERGNSIAVIVNWATQMKP